MCAAVKLKFNHFFVYNNTTKSLSKVKYLLNVARGGKRWWRTYTSTNTRFHQNHYNLIIHPHAYTFCHSTQVELKRPLNNNKNGQKFDVTLLLRRRFPSPQTVLKQLQWWRVTIIIRGWSTEMSLRPRGIFNCLNSKVFVKLFQLGREHGKIYITRPSPSQPVLLLIFLYTSL